MHCFSGPGRVEIDVLNYHSKQIVKMVFRADLIKGIVVYFNQRLGAAHPKCWSKYAFLTYAPKTEIIGHFLGAPCDIYFILLTKNPNA